jgi:putative transposase
MEIFKEYGHYPPHLFRSKAMYLVTGSVLRRQRLFDTNVKLEFLCRTLMERALYYNWQLTAWAILPNHYHFVALAPDDAETLVSLIRAVHSISARKINSIDNTPGRRVWWNYWDTCIRDEETYLAMVCYVQENPVKHGMVDRVEDYPFCSYKWFMEEADPYLRQKVLSQSVDLIHVFDEY